MSNKNKRLNDIAQEQGSSSWLTLLPIKQLGFLLSKVKFWGVAYLRYGLPLKRLPVTVVVQKFTQFSMHYRAKRRIWDFKA